MKVALSAFFALSLLLLTGLCPAPASADSGRLSKMINATEDDYEALRGSFKQACSSGAVSGKEKQEVDEAVRRITARREALSNLIKIGVRTLPISQKGLFILLARDLDQINVSLLALAKDDRGYKGYIRTGNESLLKGIRVWQSGIENSLDDTKRCMELARKATGPFLLSARLMPLQAH